MAHTTWKENSLIRRLPPLLLRTLDLAIPESQSLEIHKNTIYIDPREYQQIVSIKLGLFYKF